MRDLLRLATLGSVDDGKSTLLGRLLYECGALTDADLARATRGSEPDWSLLLDGLGIEREQGITIDVAYRYFSTKSRKFILADAPGHEQYTRNAVTAASHADLILLLLDATKLDSPQTRRHAFVAAMLGIPHLVVLVNKMDLVDFQESAFEAARESFIRHTARLDIPDLRFIPICARAGDNLTKLSARMPWFHHQPLLELLQEVRPIAARNLVDLRFPVQLTLRSGGERRYAGQVVSGVVRRGEELLILPSQQRARVKKIHGPTGEIERAFPPLSVGIELEEQRDISRGDLLVHPENQPRSERRIEAMLVWLDEEALAPSGRYRLRIHTQSAAVERVEVLYRLDLNGFSKTTGGGIGLNEIGRVRISCVSPLLCDPYRKNRATGGFVLVDELTGRTCAAGTVIDRLPVESASPARDEKPVRHSKRHHPLGGIDRAARTARLGHPAYSLWIHGPVSVGKSELALWLEQQLFKRGALTQVVRGGELRQGLCADLDHTPRGTLENTRRAAEVAKALNSAGVIALCALVSPGRRERELAREIIGAERFLEVSLEAPTSWCEGRDESGVYQLARVGELANVAGLDRELEPAEASDFHFKMTETSLENAGNQILEALKGRGLMPKQDE